MSARILTVDDNPTNLKLAREVLTFDGFEVEGAESAERALQVLQHFPPNSR